MTVIVNVQEAKTRLSELLARVEKGEDVVIARGGHPVAHLTPVETPAPRTFGVLDFHVPASFFEDLPESEVAAWE